MLHLLVIFIAMDPPSHVRPSNFVIILKPAPEDYICLLLRRAERQRHLLSSRCHHLRRSSPMESQAQRQRSSSASSSPEFEFWMVRNPSLTPTEVVTADELIVNGVVVPLHLLSLHRSFPSVLPSPEPPPYPPPHPPAESQPDSVLAPSSFSAAPATGSRRWKNLFKVAGERPPEEKEKDSGREKRDRRSSGSRSSTGELNINLNFWPFSRSQSAGNTAVPPRSSSSFAGRKISSAPCSRSNSRGESSTGGGRRWASSPARGGVYIGRSTPVWKLRRTGMGPKDKARKSSAATHSAAYVAGNSSAAAGVRLLNLNVNSCIGFQNQVSCRDDDSDGLTGGARSGEGNGINGSIFNLRALFSKKIY